MPSKKDKTPMNDSVEIYRLDYISSMRQMDDQPLEKTDYVVLNDKWKSEYDKGVQVPSNSNPVGPSFSSNPLNIPTKPFALPTELIRSSIECPQPMEYFLAPSYDVDTLDQHFIAEFNRRRRSSKLDMEVFEEVMDALDEQCNEMIERNQISEHLVGGGEDTVCSVCKDPSSDEGNQIVFCDGCNLPVHQICYGIPLIPQGAYYCSPCLSKVGKPICHLCGGEKGAFKCNTDGSLWFHVTCVLWIPEVSMESPLLMEPVIGVDNIPTARWGLKCSLCRRRVGVCLQCSVTNCISPFHVSCAFDHDLEMVTVMDEADHMDVNLRAYCRAHSEEFRGMSGCRPVSLPGKIVSSSSLTRRARQCRPLSLTGLRDFHNHTNSSSISDKLFIPLCIVECISEYWQLKRAANFFRPLVPAPSVRDPLREYYRNQYRVIKRSLKFRQQLESIRNLTYMVDKRERTKSALIDNAMAVFNSRLTHTHSFDRIRAKYISPYDDIHIQPTGVRREVSSDSSDCGIDKLTSVSQLPATIALQMKKRYKLSAKASDSKREAKDVNIYSPAVQTNVESSPVEPCPPEMSPTEPYPAEPSPADSSEYPVDLIKLADNSSKNCPRASIFLSETTDDDSHTILFGYSSPSYVSTPPDPNLVVSPSIIEFINQNLGYVRKTTAYARRMLNEAKRGHF